MKNHYFVGRFRSCTKTTTAFLFCIYLSSTALAQQQDLNTRPTLQSIDDRIVRSIPDTRYIPLAGITAGTETTQTIHVSVTTSNGDLFEKLDAVSISNGEGAIQYRVRKDAYGTATISVTITDDGVPAATITRQFTLTVEPASKNVLPTAAPIAASLNANAGSLAITAYPNPTVSSTQINFFTPKNEKHISIDLFSPMGIRLLNIYQGSTEGGKVYRRSLQLSHLSAGVYLVKLSTENSNKMTRIVIYK